MGVNNFLTDLVDETLHLNASCLMVEGDQKPVVVIDGKRKAIREERVDCEELFEDIKGLGLLTNARYMQSYTHETLEGSVYKVFVAVDRDDYHVTFYISRTIKP